MPRFSGMCSKWNILISVVDLIAVLGPRRPSVHSASWWLEVVDHLGVWCRRGGATHDGCDGSGTLVFESPGDRWNPWTKSPKRCVETQKMGPKNMNCVIETAFGWATFVLFFERYGFRWKWSVVPKGWFLFQEWLDTYSKFVSCNWALQRQYIAWYTYNHICVLMKYVIYSVVSIACPFVPFFTTCFQLSATFFRMTCLKQWVLSWNLGSERYGICFAGRKGHETRKEAGRFKETT